MKNNFLSIGKAAKQLNVHIETLRRWENDGYITPHYTKRGHRRYYLQDLEELMGYPKKNNVLLVHREKNKIAGINLTNIPRKGDLIWLNFTCYKVDKVVHFVTSNRTNDEDHPRCPYIYISDILPEEAVDYWMASPDDFDREDWAGHINQEKVMIGIYQYDACVSNSKGYYELNLFVEKEIKDHFSEESEHEIKLQTGKLIKAKVLLHYDSKEDESFVKVLLREI